MNTQPDHMTDSDNAMSALSLLAQPFFDLPLCLDGMESIEDTALPSVERGLLVHENHMTSTLQTYHKEPVALCVLRHHQCDHYYFREIVLTLPSTNTIVEYGIVRINLEVLSKSVRDEILAKHRPLGDILRKHDVLRRVEPRWFLRFAPRAVIWKNMEPPVTQETFGRIGMIYCHHQPAIELLEVVINVDQTHDDSPSCHGTA